MNRISCWMEEGAPSRPWPPVGSHPTGGQVAGSGTTFFVFLTADVVKANEARYELLKRSIGSDGAVDEGR